MVNRGWTYEITTETDRSTNQEKQLRKDDRPRHENRRQVPENGWKGGQTRAGRVYPNLTNRTDPDVSNVTNMIILQLSVTEKRRAQEVDLVTTEVDQRTLVAGTVNDQPVEIVLLDTGAERTLVDS